MQLNNNPHPLQPRQETYDENLRHLQTSNPDKILFDMSEVARMLSVSYEYVRQMVSNGVISSVQMGRRRLVHRSELARLITEGITNVGKEK